MALKLPNIDQLSGQAVPTRSRQIVDIPVNNNSGLASLGEGMVRLSTAIGNYQLNKALTEFQKGKMQADVSAQNDPEWKGLAKRYDGSLKSLASELESKVELPAVKKQFNLRIQPLIAEGTARAQSISLKRYAQVERAGIDKDAVDLSNQAVSSGDLAGARSVFETRVDSAVGANLLSPEEAQQMKQSWLDTTASSYIESLPADQKLKAAESSWIKQLSPQVRVRLHEKAKKEYILDQATTMASELVEKGVDRKALLASLDKLPKEMRAAVLTKYSAMKSQYQQAENEQDRDILDKWVLQVAEGKVTIDQIPEFDLLSGRAQKQLYELQQRYVDRQLTRRTALDKAAAKQKMAEVYLAVNELAAAGNKEGAQKLLYTKGVAHAGDNPTWFEGLANKVRSPDKIPNIISPVANTALKNLNDTDRMEVQEKLEKWYTEHRQLTGREPSPADVDKMAITLAGDQAVGHRWWWADPTKPVYEMTPKEIAAATDLIKQDNPEVYNEVAQEITVRGVKLPAVEILQMLRSRLEE